MSRKKINISKCKGLDCERLSFCKGFCKTHYAMFSRNIDPAKTKINASYYDGMERIGYQYNYWTIIKYADSLKYGKAKVAVRRYLCRCKCGNEKIIPINNLVSGLSQSCGCKPFEGSKSNITKKEKILYRLWAGMMERCYTDRGYNGYKNYGGRGIDVCEQWHNPEVFINDIKKILGERPSTEHSLDRRDNDKGYYPDNIRWATQKQQMNNTRYSNVLTAKKLAEATGYTRERIRQLTYITTSDRAKNNGLPLKQYIEKEIKEKKKTHYIYKPEAIEYLMKRIKTKLRHQLLFAPFRYVDFMRDNVFYLEQLASLLEVKMPSLRTHVSNDKIRKEHFHLLKEKGYNVEQYLIKESSNIKLLEEKK